MKELLMGEMTDKAKAAANAEGKTQKAKGTMQDVTGTVKGKLCTNV
jgi:uncharacterized protein YjbJ (UPF0337 family)